MAVERGVGKCERNYAGSFGYPTRPNAPYDFCPQCGNPMVWYCPNCRSPLPDDPGELVSARFCPNCGASYFPQEGDETEA